MKTIIIEKSQSSLCYAFLNSNRIRLAASVAVFAVTLLGIMPSRAAVVVSDDFSTGTAGATLNGQAPFFYNTSYYASSPLWTASNISDSTPLGSVVSAGAYGIASVTVPNFPSTDPTATLTLAATLTLGTSTWESINFFSSSTPAVFSNSLISLVIDTTGMLYVDKNNYTATLGQHGISGFSNTQAYTLMAVYDLSAGKISAYVDGSLLGTYNVGSLNSSDINSVGFVLNGSGGSADDFSLSTSAVPEPTSVAMIFFGVAGLIFVTTVGSRNNRRLASK